MPRSIAEKKENLLLVACSETDSNMYYATRFLAPDSFIYLHAKGKSYLLMSDLEVDRARQQARVDRVLSYSEYERRVQENGIRQPGVLDVICGLLREKKINEVTVPGCFPLEYGDGLRARGIVLKMRSDPFFPERLIKTGEEIQAIRETQIAVEEAMDGAIDLLRRSRIKGNRLVLDGSVVTSESLRRHLHFSLMEKGCIAQHTIVACGVEACDPHNIGSGPIAPHQPIIFDVFPRSSGSRYYADMSRTVVRGKPTEGLRRLYDTVLAGQELGISRVCEGANGREIHEEIVMLFEKRGYLTGKKNGRMQGFFHGTGHGVGIDIHEPPRISKRDWILQKGEVVTVEPGLYYPEIGAVRIEDMVLVEAKGCKNLTTYPKVLEIV